jgi:hypothetical protein
MFYIRKYIFHLTFLIPLKYIVTAILGIKNLRESVPVQFRRMYSYKTFSVYFLKRFYNKSERGKLKRFFAIKLF